ncbi:MAG TPA: LON peptidase substrate-binding domain-containing protein [Steroidobacter sp.]|jgi:Lon protease-like protein|nr:LON peptidase substrate-binding domain-containing protein [Steroidobacteraceae bacterium]HLS80310.1 LON peptidase substrate-binding domain-containing protein [Steroidobacter sp.]
MNAPSGDARRIPLFPLNAVLFPGGPLRLRIFEPRYLDMIGRCMREDSGFGVAMIVEGVEAGGEARTACIGTLARIVDFDRLSDGLLGVTARGGARFEIMDVQLQSDRLNVAAVEWLEQEASVAAPPEYELLAELARRAFPQLAAVYGDLQPEYDDASWIGMRLAEMLPLPLEDRQRCLEIRDALERLEFLNQRIKIKPA